MRPLFDISPARTLALALALCLATLVSSPVAAQPAPPGAPAEVDEPDPAGPFAQGKVRISAGGGMVGAFGTRYFALHANVGYFLFDGFELGLGFEQWFGSGPLVSKLSPQLRYVFWMVPVLTPYLGGFYRHWFIGDDVADIDTLGGSAGAFVRSDVVTIGGGVVLEQAVSGCEDDCFWVYPEIILSMSF